MSAWTTRGLRKVYSCHLTPLCVQEEVPKGDLHHGGSATSKGAAQQLPSRDAQTKIACIHQASGAQRGIKTGPSVDWLKAGSVQPSWSQRRACARDVRGGKPNLQGPPSHRQSPVVVKSSRSESHQNHTCQLARNNNSTIELPVPSHTLCQARIGGQSHHSQLQHCPTPCQSTR